jgi:hypothetical protein
MDTLKVLNGAALSVELTHDEGVAGGLIRTYIGGDGVTASIDFPLPVAPVADNIIVRVLNNGSVAITLTGVDAVTPVADELLLSNFSTVDVFFNNTTGRWYAISGTQFGKVTEG